MRRKQSFIWNFIGTGLLVALSSSLCADYVPGTLVAYWPLDETNATELQVEDVSGNGNHGVRRDGFGGIPFTFPQTSGPLITTAGPVINAVPTNALEFDKVDDIGKVDDAPSLDFNKTRGSISFWINTDTPDDRMSILRTVTNGAYEGPAIEKTGSAQSQRVFFTPNIQQSASFFMAEALPTPNTWQHYVFTWDYTETNSGVTTNPNRVKCYVNGVQTTNRTAGGGTGDLTYTAIPTSSGDWILGRRHLATDIEGATTRPFDGEMAEFAVFDTDIAAADAAFLFNNGVTSLITVDNPALAANLVAYWNFSEGSGNTVADDAGTNESMSLCRAIQGTEFNIGQGGTWAVANATNKPAYISRAFEFDGVDDLFTVPDSASMDFSKTQGTIVTWAHFDGAAPIPREGIVADTTGSVVAQVSSNGRMAFTPTSNTNTDYLTLDNSPDVPGNTWVHLAYVFDKTQPDSGNNSAPNKVKVYFDGVLIANTNAASSDPDTNWINTAFTGDWVFGRRHVQTDVANARWMNGQMADAAFFSVPLSAADIIDIRTNGVAAFVAPALPATANITPSPNNYGLVFSDSVNGATYTIENPLASESDLVISAPGFTFSGTNAGLFSVSGTPSFPINVAPGATTTLDIDYAPAGDDGVPHTATATLVSNAVTAPTVNLSGSTYLDAADIAAARAAAPGASVRIIGTVVANSASNDVARGAVNRFAVQDASGTDGQSGIFIDDTGNIIGAVVPPGTQFDDIAGTLVDDNGHLEIDLESSTAAGSTTEPTPLLIDGTFTVLNDIEGELIRINTADIAETGTFLANTPYALTSPTGLVVTTIELAPGSDLVGSAIPPSFFDFIGVADDVSGVGTARGRVLSDIITPATSVEDWAILEQ